MLQYMYMYMYVIVTISSTDNWQCVCNVVHWLHTFVHMYIVRIKRTCTLCTNFEIVFNLQCTLYIGVPHVVPVVQIVTFCIKIKTSHINWFYRLQMYNVTVHNVIVTSQCTLYNLYNDIVITLHYKKCNTKMYIVSCPICRLQFTLYNLYIVTVL